MDMIDILEILGKIGFDWQVALVNTINFLLVFFLLQKFLFPTLRKAVEDRRAKIKEGLDKAQEADVRLKEIDRIGVEKIREAESAAMATMKAAESRAKDKEKAMEESMEQKRQDIAALLRSNFAKQQAMAEKQVAAEAVAVIKEAMVNAIELKPEAVDEVLITKAVAQATKKRHETSTH